MVLLTEYMKSHVNCSHHACATDTDIKKISKVLVIIGIFMFLELWGHYKTHSLSLLADSLHLLVDISGFIVSIFTLQIAKRKESKSMTFGYQRVEILGALISVMLIWAAVIYLVIESFHKYMHPKEIDSSTFMSIAVIGLGVNIGCIFVLHRDEYQHQIRGENLNIRATYVHVIGDIIQSVGVIIASVVIYFWPQMVIADIICTLFFAFLVLFSTGCILRDAFYILAEGAPTEIDQDEIRNYVLGLDPVIRIEEMKLWSISVNKNAIILRILVDHILIREYERMVQDVKKFLKEKGIDLIYISVDTPSMVENVYGLQVGLS